MSRRGIPGVDGFGRVFAGALGLAALVSQARAAAGDAPEFVLRPAVTAFAKANGIAVDGIDRPKDLEVAAIGDAVTALATLQEGGARQQWLIELKVVAPTDAERAAKPQSLMTVPVNGHLYRFGSGSPVGLEIYTAGPFEDGSAEPGRERRARAVVASDYLGFGAAPLAKFLIHLQGPGGASASITSGASPKFSEDQERAVASGFCALSQLLSVIQKTPGLAELFWRVAEKPSIWSIVKAGASRSLFMGTDGRITEVNAEPWRLRGEDVYRMPFVVRFGQQPLLSTDLFVGPSQSPLSATAGTVGIIAVSPGAKTRRLEVRLLAAHRAH